MSPDLLRHRNLLSRTMVFSLAAVGLVINVRAADQTVSDLGDNGLATQLRKKVTDCLNTGGGTIRFAQGLSGLIVLTSTLPAIQSPVSGGSVGVTIEGADVITI